MGEYSDKLKDPRWQRKRLEILERDDFTCQSCMDSESTLVVHHRYYENVEPWEYPNEALVTLCANCHEAQLNLPTIEKSLLRELRTRFLVEDISSIAIGLHMMEMIHLPEVQASMIEWALSSPDILHELMDKYFEHIRIIADEKAKAMESANG